MFECVCVSPLAGMCVWVMGWLQLCFKSKGVCVHACVRECVCARECVSKGLGYQQLCLKSKSV